MASGTTLLSRSQAVIEHVIAGQCLSIGYDVRNDGDQSLPLTEVYVDGYGPDGYWKAWACGGPNGQPACSALDGHQTMHFTSILGTAGSPGTWSIGQAIVYYTGGPYRVLATDVGTFTVTGAPPPTFEQEPNNTPAQASPFSIGTPISGYFMTGGPAPNYGGDVDWYKLTVPGPGRLVVHADPPNGGGQLGQLRRSVPVR